MSTDIGNDTTAATATGAEQLLVGRRALVVDDSGAACAILRGILERDGMQVDTASEGGIAISLVTEQPDRFDVILMDLVMEGVGGLDAIGQIHPMLQPGLCPIVAMSATVTPEVEAQCVSLGAYQRVLKKPFRAAEVLACVRDVLADAGNSVGKSAAMLQAPNVPHLVNGIDIDGAIERCGGDLSLLRSLVRQLGDNLPGIFQQIRQALAAADMGAFLARLHKLRGEVLNLGMAIVAGKIAEAEAGGVEPSAARIDLIEADLDRAISQLRGAPQLQAQGSVFSFDGIGEQVFISMVQALAQFNLCALDYLPASGRVLPARYSASTDAAFRQLVEALDFTGARALLLPPDDVTGDQKQASEPMFLIVDDDPGSVRVLAGALKGMGEIRFALSGEAGLAIAAQITPDVVITDVHMGQMSGIELCRAIKGLPGYAEVPVIVSSADAKIATEVKALTAGAVDFIEKPFRAARIIVRVNTQLQIRKRNQQIRQLLLTQFISSAPTDITCDLAGRLLAVGPGLADLLGSPQRIQPGMFLVELFVRDSRSAVLDALRWVALPGNNMETILVSLQAASGASLPVKLRLRLLNGEQGTQIWISLDDMRDQLQLERTQLEHKKRQALSSITSGIAHEFNNLLAIVIGNLDNAIEAPDDRTHLAKRLRAAQAAAMRAAGISRALRDAAQRTARPGGLPVPLKDLIGGVWPLLEKAVPRGIRLFLDTGEIVAWVRLDPEGLKSALFALLDNAADAMPEGGEVVVRAVGEYNNALPENDPGHLTARIEVCDKGEGMSVEVRDRMFDPFFTTRMPEHVGLGLVDVTNFLSSHGGSVDVHSVQGAGTTVALSFPAANPNY